MDKTSVYPHRDYTILHMHLDPEQPDKVFLMKNVFNRSRDK